MKFRVITIISLCLLLWPNAVNGSKKKNNQTRPKIGLVLGGGGAKGAAEVGVLKYIEQAGVPIDYIAGTSIGSIVGALYSVGYRSEELDSLFHSQEWLSLLADRDMSLSSHFFSKRDSTVYVLGFPIKRPKIKTPNHRRTIGLSRGDSIISLFDRMTGQPDSVDFDKLPIPFRCVAVDILKFREVVLSKGNLSRAMRASMAIPGVFKPVEQNDMVLVDGGLLNNLPVDVVREMGADIVIAVDLTQNKHENRKEKDISNEQNDPKKQRLPALISWLYDRPDLEKYKNNSNLVDIYINPDLQGYSAADFKPKKIAEMITIGEIAGKNAFEQLQKLAKECNSVQTK